MDLIVCVVFTSTYAITTYVVRCAGNKLCQYTPVYSSNTNDRHHKTEMLLKVALSSNNIWVSDCWLAPTQQFVSYIVARTS
jgi:hypothetical protein